MMRIAASMLLVAVAFFGAAHAEERAPVVVELYTSEGCSSCPPADEFLAELARRPEVLALAFHVDYWDYLGWADRFAKPDYTQRQRSYARALGSPMVYTPQAVVDGAAHIVGSDRAGLETLIRAAREAMPVAAIELAWTADGNLQVTIPVADYQGAATVWFVRYDDRGVSEVADGENAGKTLHHVNIVRELTAIGMWDGTAFSTVLPAEAVRPADYDSNYGCAIIVQPEGLGPILGARRIDAAG
jgi:hypothetical protein